MKTRSEKVWEWITVVSVSLNIVMLVLLIAVSFLGLQLTSSVPSPAVTNVVQVVTNVVTTNVVSTNIPSVRVRVESDRFFYSNPVKVGGSWSDRLPDGSMIRISVAGE